MCDRDRCSRKHSSHLSDGLTEEGEEDEDESEEVELVRSQSLHVWTRDLD